MLGFRTLLVKEILRFWKVWMQTLLAPLVSTLLYLVVFAQITATHAEASPGITHAAFLIPGLSMMAMVQNAFANSSSSLVQSKVTGNLIFVLLTPLSSAEFYLAYALAAMVRGILVGLVVLATAWAFVPLPAAQILWTVAFALLGTLFSGSLGIIAGIWAEKFDHMALWQNFIILPLTFLSGAFYSIHSLPAAWSTLSRLNPFFYMIDGFRYGLIGTSDVSPWVSLWIVTLACLALSWLNLWLLGRGWRLRT
jgi:ABC-2 type transport system permease protein